MRNLFRLILSCSARVNILTHSLDLDVFTDSGDKRRAPASVSQRLRASAYHRPSTTTPTQATSVTYNTVECSGLPI